MDDSLSSTEAAKSQKHSQKIHATVPWSSQLYGKQFRDSVVVFVLTAALVVVLGTSARESSGGVNLLSAILAISLTAWAIWGLIHITRFYSIHVACASCGNRFATNVPWRCGFCHALNRSKLARSSIAGSCGTCREAVPAYECHFCGFENALKANWDGRHTARHADTPWAPTPGETHEQARARKRRAQEEAEEDTRLTVLQTQKLRAEYELMMQERHNEAAKQQAKPQPRIDPAERVAQQFAAAIGALLDSITTRKKLRETINQQREGLKQSPQYQALSAEERERFDEHVHVIADRLEQQLRDV